VQLPYAFDKKEDDVAWVDTKERITIQFEDVDFSMSVHELALKGKHNTYNSMAAGIAGNVLKIRNEIIREALMDFQGIEHRLEHLNKVHGINFINDSKATNVNSTWYALESVKGNIIWIAGGVDKGNNYSELYDLVSKRVKAIVCLGDNNKRLLEAFNDKVETMVETKTMSEAVKSAYYLASKEDTVLLSPACASFDLFDSYEDRGWKFKTAVREL
jgi:UDP-N-acetylmuramoylalanine--D-glutamate ligase